MMKPVEAIFTVILKDGKPWLKWEQYETTFLRIWKANSPAPYVKWNGLTVTLDADMMKQLKAIM